VLLKGIIGPNDLLKVGTLPAKKIEKLHHDLFNFAYFASILIAHFRTNSYADFAF
jgi:hypothetical protein